MMTTEQAAKELGVSARRILAMIKAGQLPAVKFGPVWMVTSVESMRNRNPKGGRPIKTDNPRKATGETGKSTNCESSQPAKKKPLTTRRPKTSKKTGKKTLNN